MHADEVTGYLKKDWGINPVQVMMADRVYVCADEGWFFEKFASALGSFFGNLKVADWIAEENDCDDFARGAAWLAQVLHHRTNIAAKKVNVRSALAIGEFWYFRKGNPLDEHALVVAVMPGVKDGRQTYRPVFMEPQTQQRAEELTEAERISCTALRF